MPNIKRRFADDDPSSSDDDDDDDEEEEEPQFAARGGKGIRMPGGKGFGKQLRAPPQQEGEEESDEDSDDDEEEQDQDAPETQPPQPQGFRQASGKQLRPSGGKQLRAPGQQEEEEDESDDDDDEEEDEELNDDEPVRPVQRGGGKALMRMRPADDDEEEKSSSSEEEAPPPRVVQRGGGGKSLMRMQEPQGDDDDDDDDDDEDEEENEPIRPVQRGGGKALSRMTEPVARGGGKQLRPTNDEDEEDEDEDEDEDDDEEEEEPTPAPQAPQVVQRGGGKSLMRTQAPSEDEEEDDDDDEDSSDEEEATAPVQAPPRGGGKQLRPMEDDEPKPKASIQPSKPVVQQVRQVGGKQLGGKQLGKPTKDDSSDSDDNDDDMEVDSDDDEKESPPKEDATAKVAAPPEDDEEEDEEEDEPPPKKPQEPAKKAPPPKPAAAAKKKKAEPESDAMEESEDDDDDDDDESSEEENEMDNEDAQQLVKDDADQNYLDSLPEIEREAILAERFEKRKAELDMKKALRESKRKKRDEKSTKDQLDSKKRKAPPAKKPPAKKPPAKKVQESEPEDTTGDAELAASLANKRESGRNKDVKGSKAVRAKALEKLRKERKKVVKKDSDESSFGDDDDDDSDDDYDDGTLINKPWLKKSEDKPSTVSKLGRSDDSDEENDGAGAKADTAWGDDAAAQGPAEEADLESYLKITLPRRRLARWCNEPFFKEAVMGCFVKLFVGENEEGKRCYRLCRIVSVKSDNPYELPKIKNEKQVKTDKYLKLKFGKNERDFPIKLVSDAKIVQDDVNQFVTSMKAVREPTLTKREANKKRKSQDDLVNNYVYTVEDIESNMKDRKKKGMPVANMGSEQTKAAVAVQGARDSLQEAKIQYTLAQKRSDDANIADAALAVQKAEQRLKERLDTEQKLLEFVTNHKQRLTSRSKDQKWAKVNQRAKEANNKADLEVAKEKEETGSANAFNPYARRKVKPTILWEVGQQDEKKSDETAADAKKDALSSAANKESTAAEDATTPSLIQEQQEKAAALSQSHQFAIDEEVLALSSYTKGISGLGSNKRVRKRVRKGLSLSEYQERKAAGTL